MYLGGFYLDWYNAPQFAMLGSAILCLFGSAFIVIVAALRAALKGWFVSAGLLTATAAFIPIAVILTVLAGPYFDQLWNWFIYQSSFMGNSYGYTYGNQYTVPWRPDFNVIYYGIPTGHALAMGGSAVAMALMGLAVNVLIPVGRGGGVFIEERD